MAFEIKLANSRGMCAGVERAISSVEKTLDKFGKNKVFVLHEVVHNKHVVDDLKQAGAIFVEDIQLIPDGSVMIISAHGASIKIFDIAKEKNLHVIDATCPVVTAIHNKMKRASSRGFDAVVIGHKKHQEVLGTVGQYPENSSKVHVIIDDHDIDNLEIDDLNSIFVTQTTLSVDETKKCIEKLKLKYPNIKGPSGDDTCRATQVRQNAVKELATLCDVVIIAGSSNSSNSNRLREVAENSGAKAYLVEDQSMISVDWLNDVKNVGVTAGASAPEYVVQGIIEFLKQHGATNVVSVGSELRERSFSLPKELI